MTVKKAFVYFFILIFQAFIFPGHLLKAQISDIEKSENEALGDFTSGNYRDALSEFDELIKHYPQNPDYQYYSGRCLLELDENNSVAINNLRFAAVKGNKTDSWFYLGEAYKNANDFEKAIQSYKRFISDAKKSDIKKLNAKEILAVAENDFKEFKKQSGEKKIGIEDSSIKDKANHVAIPPSKNKDENIVPAQEPTKSNELTNPRDESSTDRSAKLKTNDNSIITDNSENLSSRNLSEALKLQLSADSLNRIAKTKRALLKETEYSEERKNLINEISLLEKESIKKQSEADKYYLRLQEKSGNFKTYDSISDETSVIELKEEINGIKVYQYKENISLEKPNVNEEPVVDNNPEKKASKELKKASETEFSLNSNSVYSDINPIPLRMPVLDTLIYTIQLGVFSKKVDNAIFCKFSPVCYDKIKDREIYKYYAGQFKAFKKANEALITVRQSGFPDAFIIAFYKNEQVNIEKAQQIEYSRLKY